MLHLPTNRAIGRIRPTASEKRTLSRHFGVPYRTAAQMAALVAQMEIPRARRPSASQRLKTLKLRHAEHHYPDRFVTGVHEAGHALAAIACGIPVRIASTISSDVGLGVVKFGERYLDAPAADRLFAIVAGPAAERRFLESKAPIALQGADLQLARDAAGTEAVHLSHAFGVACRRADAFLDNVCNWAEVKKLAARLCVDRFISGRDLDVGTLIA